jgi:hypothetical protein
MMRGVSLVVLLVIWCLVFEDVSASSHLEEDSASILSLESEEAPSMTEREIEAAELLFARIESLHASAERIRRKEEAEEYGDLYESDAETQHTQRTHDRSVELDMYSHQDDSEGSQSLRRKSRGPSSGRIYTYNEETNTAYDIYHATDVHPIASKLTYHTGKSSPPHYHHHYRHHYHLHHHQQHH